LIAARIHLMCCGAPTLSETEQKPWAAYALVAFFAPVSAVKILLIREITELL